MNQVDGVTHTLPLCGSVWGKAQKRDNGHCLASGVLSSRKLSPGTFCDARHFNFSLYATGALLAIALELSPIGVDYLSPKSVADI